MSEDTRTETVVEGLPAGWRRQELIRPKGLRVTTGHTEVYYISPDGARCANKREMWGMLSVKDRERIDLTQFDWQSGKMLQQSTSGAQAKAKRPRLTTGAAASSREKPVSAVDHTRLPSSSTSNYQMPVRQSLPFTLSSRQSVTVVRNSVDGERKEREPKPVGYDDAPRQLFWEKRLAPTVTYVDSESEVPASASATSDTASGASGSSRKPGSWPARLVPNAPNSGSTSTPGGGDEQHLLVLRSVTELLNEAAARARSNAGSALGPLVGQQLRFGAPQPNSSSEGTSSGFTCAPQQSVAHQQAVAAALRDVQQPLVTRLSVGELNTLLRAEVRRGETRVRRLRRCLQTALEAFGDDCARERRADAPASDLSKVEAAGELSQPQPQPQPAAT